MPTFASQGADAVSLERPEQISLSSITLSTSFCCAHPSAQSASSYPSLDSVRNPTLGRILPLACAQPSSCYGGSFLPFDPCSRNYETEMFQLFFGTGRVGHSYTAAPMTCVRSMYIPDVVRSPDNCCSRINLTACTRAPSSRNDGARICKSPCP